MRSNKDNLYGGHGKLLIGPNGRTLSPFMIEQIRVSRPDFEFPPVQLEQPISSKHSFSRTDAKISLQE